MRVREVPARWVDAPPEIRRWSREEYERAGELGIFGPTERLELIGGEVIRKVSPQRSPHATAVQLAHEALRERAGTARGVRSQLPLALGDDSEPEPDIAVVEGTLHDYVHAHPTTALLVIEVADSTLTFDRIRKASCTRARASLTIGFSTCQTVCWSAIVIRHRYPISLSDITPAASRDTPRTSR
jgi:Uma2 family endonuclease